MLSTLVVTGRAALRVPVLAAGAIGLFVAVAPGGGLAGALCAWVCLRVATAMARDAAIIADERLPPSEEP